MRYVVFLAGLLLCQAGLHAAESTESALFAVVNGTAITMDEYAQAVVGGARNKFYHRTPPEAEVKQFRFETGQRLIEESLLVEEAMRLGISADKKWVEAELAKFDQRYGSNPDWQAQRPTAMPAIEKSLRTQSQLKGLMARIENVPGPDDTAIRGYYEKKADLFTTPRQMGVSMILLKVDPSAGSVAWESAKDEASKLTAKIRSSDAKFEELARIHSHDPSAEKGGDLGFIHEGMLGSNAQATLNGLSIGEVSDPVQILEGYAVFRLNKINVPALSPYETVRVRAKQLWKRDRVAAAIANLRAALLADASVEIHDAQFKEWWGSRSGQQAPTGSPAASDASANGR